MTIPSLTKNCTQCGCEKPHSDFCKRKSAKDGLRIACKSCEYAKKSGWTAANKAKIQAYNAAYHAANKEKNNLACLAWRAANPEKIKAYKLETYEVEMAKGRVRSRARYYADKEESRIHKQNRRALARISGGKLSIGLRAKLFKLQKGKCPCCGLPLGNDSHIDHIVPLAMGGANIDANTQLMRSSCNQKKSSRHPVDFMQSRGFLL